MATGNILAQGNIDKFVILTRTIDIPSVSANTTADFAFTVTGAQSGDFVMVNIVTPTTGVGIVNARVTSNNFVTVTVMNATGAPVDPAVTAVRVFIIRTDADVTGTGW